MQIEREFPTTGTGTGWRIAVWGALAALMALPIVASQFTDAIQWTAFDFAFAAVLLGGIGLAFELLNRRANGFAYRAAAALSVAGIFLLVWITAAVGIIGSEQNDANAMYGALLFLGLGGAIAVRLRARGMARTLVAVAAAQVGIGAVALVGRLGADGPVWPNDVIFLTGMFTAIWLSAAALYARAAR